VDDAERPTSARGRRRDMAGASPERDGREALPRAAPGDGDVVAVLKEGALLAAGERHRLLPGASDLEKTTQGVCSVTRDGPASKKIACLDVAAVARQMGDHLPYGPIQFARGSLSEHDRAGIGPKRSRRRKPR